jgi:hypothetical protein
MPTPRDLTWRGVACVRQKHAEYLAGERGREDWPMAVAYELVVIEQVSQLTRQGGAPP